MLSPAWGQAELADVDGNSYSVPWRLIGENVQVVVVKNNDPGLVAPIV